MRNNELVILIGILTAILIIINLIISIRISHELKRKNIDAEIAHRRGIIFKYLKIYKQNNIEENGKPGLLYYLFIISFSLFMTSLLTGIILSSCCPLIII